MAINLSSDFVKRFWSRIFLHQFLPAQQTLTICDPIFCDEVLLVFEQVA